jgi:hypothetical protein
MGIKIEENNLGVHRDHIRRDLLWQDDLRAVQFAAQFFQIDTAMIPLGLHIHDQISKTLSI